MSTLKLYDYFEKSEDSEVKSENSEVKLKPSVI